MSRSVVKPKEVELKPGQDVRSVENSRAVLLQGDDLKMKVFHLDEWQNFLHWKLQAIGSNQLGFANTEAIFSSPLGSRGEGLIIRSR